ncbi:receptor-type tyrosine-protein phosphatase S-like isoform X2 [Oscarella lobularis]|uniref:receptor-type tyrosine-protein phosphatase S-like isoform X2 n=1 Tax=Oscarella lobularis TaxID=121494 RepID=UPI0033138CDD
MTWSRLFLLKLAVITMVFECLQVSGASGEKKVNLDAKMLEYGNVLSGGNISYADAVDVQTGQKLTDCPNSSYSGRRPVWLSINLGRLYSVSKIRMLSRLHFGSASKIYVGKTAIKEDGNIDSNKDHKCDIRNYPTTGPIKTFTNFSCSPIRWIQYVTIHRPNYDNLQVCKVEVYYNENTADGVAITTKNYTIRSMGEIASCGSPNGDFGPIWKFPNGTKVSTKKSAAIRQVNDSSSPGYKKLRLESFIAPNGDYKCEYIANNATKTITGNIVFDCQSTPWSVCSCGRGKRTKITSELRGSTCSSMPLSEDCLNTDCGRIDMTNAVATHGPGATLVGGQTTFSASLAIDGEVMGDLCAATLLSTSPWLQVDLKTAYLITSVEASFWSNQGDGATVRVGSNLMNDGNGNPKCGQSISNSTSGKWITTVCSSPLWGRYINVQKISSKKSYLRVCELRASYKLDVGILYDDSAIASGSIYSYAGKPLPFPVLCGVNPDPTNFNSLLKIQWKFGKDGNRTSALSSNPNIGQSKTSYLRSLHIEKAPLVDQKYSCHFTWINETQKSLVFNLNINVNCTWNEWSVCSGRCGEGMRSRTTIKSKHRGKSCIGSSAEDCDTGIPCTPTPVQSLVTVQEGQQAMLECESSQYRQVATSITFEWFKDGANLTNPSSSSVRVTNGRRYRGTLTFASVNRTDASSLYTCKARGERGVSNSSTAITLHVTYAPHNVRVKSNFSAFVKEGRIILSCIVEANPLPHQYSWWKDGQVQAESGSQFVILNSSFSGNETYKCAANNSSGSSMSEIFVISLIPEKCTGLSGTSSVGNSISLTISSCPVNGNADVKKYKVLYRLFGSSDFWSAVIMAALPTINVTDFAPFTTYEIRITAGNEYGYGPNSSTIKVRTAEGEPGPPQNVSVVSLSSHSVSVSWLQPTTPHGDIAKYKIYYRIPSKTKREAANNEVFANVSGSETTVILTDVSPFTLYIIKVAAVNIRQYDNKSLEGLASKEVSVRTGGEGASKSGDGNTPIIIVVVVVVIILLVIAGIAIAFFIVRRRRKRECEVSTVKMSSVKDFDDEEDEDLPASTSLLVEVYEGSTALLPCGSAGNFDVIWCQGEKSLPGKDTRFLQLSDGQLQITAVRGSDSGTYQWTASSKSGVDEQSVELILKPVEVKEGQLGGFSGLAVGKGTRKKSESHAVHLDDFLDHVTAMNESKGAGFTEEFKELEKAKAGMELTTHAAASNLLKNRYRNILTYDHARVVLKPLPETEPLECDYIAAAYVDGHHTPKKYIASQGPTKGTAGDMWRMIWSENVRTIVMLTHLTEGNKVKCYQYWPSTEEETQHFEGFKITLDSVDNFAEYDIKSITICLGNEGRDVKLYHFTSWPDHGVPKFATGLLSFIKRVNRELPKNSGPMVVHCSAGVGRTGTFIVIDQMLENISEGLPIDVFNAVKSLRTRRQEMVQGKAQYAFIYVALLEAVLCGNTQIPVQNLCSAFSKLSEKDSKGRCGFERQYLVLGTASAHVSKALCMTGLHPSVRKKNRYLDIVPLDSERVVLRLEEAVSGDSDTTYVNAVAGSNYINASYVNGYRYRDAFIVTQGPLENTVNDFWQMVWEQDTYTIVNLTQLIEDDKEMCYQYWPKTKARYGSYEVEIDGQNSSDSYVVRKLNVSKGSEMKTVCQFHFTAWPNDECPTSATHLLEMMAQIEKWQQTTGNNVITVHCNNGIGRSGVFCTIVSVVEEMKVENVIDVFYKVKSLRIKRPGMVQSVDQYKFCYKAILDYTEGFDIYANFK